MGGGGKKIVHTKENICSLPNKNRFFQSFPLRCNFLVLLEKETSPVKMAKKRRYIEDLFLTLGGRHHPPCPCVLLFPFRGTFINKSSVLRNNTGSSLHLQAGYVLLLALFGFLLPLPRRSTNVKYETQSNNSDNNSHSRSLSMTSALSTYLSPSRTVLARKVSSPGGDTFSVTTDTSLREFWNLTKSIRTSRNCPLKINELGIKRKISVHHVIAHLK